MTDIVERLMPCPFCGHDRGEIHHNPKTILHPAYWVECGYCGASGPETDRGDHVEQWNNQPLRQQLAECQAREKVRISALKSADECISLYSHPGSKLVTEALAMPSDPTALD